MCEGRPCVVGLLRRAECLQPVSEQKYDLRGTAPAAVSIHQERWVGFRVDVGVGVCDTWLREQMDVA